MFRTFSAAIICAVAYSSPASAQTYTDVLTQCYYQSATQEEKTAWVAWTVSNLLLHPDLKDLTPPVAPNKREDIARKVMGAFERITLVECRKEAVAAIENEGEASVFRASSRFSAMVTNSYFGDPSVSAGLNESLKFFDKAKFTELGKETGLMGPPK